MRLPKESEIIVIGGGLFGCSIAYRLAKRGKEVILLEKDNICSGASGRNGGQIIQLEGRDKNPETIKFRLELTKENNSILQNLSEELEADLEYKKIGSLDIALTNEERKELQEIVGIQKKLGDKEIQFLDKKETLNICPVLTNKIKSSRFRPSDGTINPFFYTNGFAKNFKKYGGKFFTQTKVEKIIKENGKVKGVELKGKKKIKANKVINATNAWSSFLIPEIDIFPLRQIGVVTEPTAPLPVCPVEAFIEGDGIYTNIQIGSGNLLAGGFKTLSKKREDQYDEKVYLEEVEGSSAILACLYPSLQNISIIRSWAGTMAIGPDFFPAIGKVPECEGLYIAAGFYNGMAYASVIGELMAELVVKNKTPSLLKPFDPQRFYKKKFDWPEVYNCTSLAEFFART